MILINELMRFRIMKNHKLSVRVSLSYSLMHWEISP